MIITHRGLDPDLVSSGWNFPESSFSAFQNHLDRGFGIEFDPCPTRDNAGMVISHDNCLTRITNGRDNRNIKEDVTFEEATTIQIGSSGQHFLCTLEQVLAEIIRQYRESVSAMHLKGDRQDSRSLQVLRSTFQKFSASDLDILYKNLIVFDVTLETAKQLKSWFPNLQLAPSISHPYDIERYGSCVFGTLQSLSDVIQHAKNLYSWVWLDEWDLNDNNNGSKELYNEETFEECRKAGLSIALVSPELHGKSPGLLGGEAHPDSSTRDRLTIRWRKLFQLKADAICTDYPDRIINEMNQ